MFVWTPFNCKRISTGLYLANWESPRKIFLVLLDADIPCFFIQLIAGRTMILTHIPLHATLSTNSYCLRNRSSKSEISAFKSLWAPHHIVLRAAASRFMSGTHWKNYLVVDIQRRGINNFGHTLYLCQVCGWAQRIWRKYLNGIKPSELIQHKVDLWLLSKFNVHLRNLGARSKTKCS